MKTVHRAWLIRGLALAALATVFAAYLNPHLVFELSNQLWACF
jgi:hypothetical protein